VAKLVVNSQFPRNANSQRDPLALGVEELGIDIFFSRHEENLLHFCETPAFEDV
jgi:hypothetical protein